MHDGRVEASAREQEYWKGVVYQKQKDENWDGDVKMRSECKETKME